MQWTQGEFTICDETATIHIDFVHQFLVTAYWCTGIPRHLVAKAVTNSHSFMVFHVNQPIGFGRVITDHATFAYVADVFILPAYRGQGLAKWLIATIQAHPNLQGLRRMLLATWDAHGLYAQQGFTPLAHTERWMEIAVPDLYLRHLTP